MVKSLHCEFTQNSSGYIFGQFLVNVRGSGPGFESHPAALKKKFLARFDKIFKDSLQFSCEFGLFQGPLDFINSMVRS
jgi:hypothetical protein